MSDNQTVLLFLAIWGILGFLWFLRFSPEHPQIAHYTVGGPLLWAVCFLFWIFHDET